MGIHVKFTKTTHQIWSCYVTLASNSENFSFLPDSVLNFRKVTKFGVNWLKNKKGTGKKQTGGLIQLVVEYTQLLSSGYNWR